MKMIFASHNKNKLVEIQQLLGKDLVELISLEDISYHDDIIEDADTLEGNALIKSRTLYEKMKLPVFSDDTGLEVYALDMKPGVKTARFAGDQKSAEDNMTLLLELLKNRSDRRARFRTAIALILEGKEYVFEGIVEGKIGFDRTGEGGFGYDPVFIPEGHDQSFAEMSLELKNSMSHRYRALEKMKEFLKSKRP